MSKTSIILLAAGQSVRMGKINKLLLPINGEPLVRRSARILSSLDNASVCVVLGHEADEVSEVLAEMEIDVTINELYLKGQRGSVFHGLSKANIAENYMIAPADLPRLSINDCKNLLDVHKSKGQGRITIPVKVSKNGSKRGNPIILSNTAREMVVAGGLNLGCRGLIDRQPELVNSYATKSHGFFHDIDTPLSYEIEKHGK